MKIIIYLNMHLFGYNSNLSGNLAIVGSLQVEEIKLKFYMQNYVNS